MTNRQRELKLTKL